jgi:SAM-dependent methyltransferase
MSASAVDEILGMDATERAQLAARVERHLPRALVPVFGPDNLCSHLLFDEFVHRLTVQVWSETGLAEAAAVSGTAAEIVERAGLDPRPAAVAVDSMLRHLAARGMLDRQESEDGPRFRTVAGATSARDPAAVRAEQQRHDPSCLPSYALAETVARDYPAFLRGKRSGEDILLAPTRLPLWVAYFSNDNVLYAVNNRVGAVALEAWLPREPPVILELGGGCASGTTAALERLASAGRLAELRAYRFTELVPAFLRRGERNVQTRCPGVPGLTFESLDMNKPFGAQGVEDRSVSVVYAVNTLHVAHDLAFTLGEIHRALAPGGQVIISECIRLFPGQTLYPEFVFNLMGTFRAPRLHPAWRPNGGFLMAEQWAGALTAAGFRDVRCLPDIARIRHVLPTFYAGAIGATRGA